MITNIYPLSINKFTNPTNYRIFSDNFEELKKIQKNLFVFHGYSINDPAIHSDDGTISIEVPVHCLKHIISNYAKMTAAQYMENNDIK